MTGLESGVSRRLTIAAVAVVVVLLAACGASVAADPPQAPVTVVTNPVEILFDYSVLGDHLSSGDEHVLTQCDNHGHRVFISRHPEDFRVLVDPSCPGAPGR